MAKRIVAAFGVDTFDIIEAHPEQLTEVGGSLHKEPQCAPEEQSVREGRVANQLALPPLGGGERECGVRAMLTQCWGLRLASVGSGNV